jgi:hypothetical protein
MKPINEAHLSDPGLAVVEVAAADDQTAFAVQELLAGRWVYSVVWLVRDLRREPLVPGHGRDCGQGVSPE